MTLIDVRQRAFRAALAINDSSMQRWCRDYNVSYTHLQSVLRGKRPSHRLAVRLDAYIAKTLVPFAREFLRVAGDIDPTVIALTPVVSAPAVVPKEESGHAA